MLTVEQLTLSFGAQQVVRGVDLHVAPGEIVALIGPNGAGKTTTFNMINGQLATDSGRIQFNGHSLRGKTPEQIARLGIARSFQVAATFGSLTVLQNVQTALLAHHGRTFRFLSVAGKYQAPAAMQLLDQVGMAAQAHRACSTLAYGDVKRVELAMALASEPRLLLMDEPTAGMAPAERRALMTQVRDVARQRGMAILFTEHSMDIVFDHADRVVVLARGQIIASGTPQEIRDHAEVRRVYFGGKTEPGQPVGGPSDANLRSRHDGKPILQAQGLNAWYGAAHILHDVDLKVYPGEVTALLGRNGAGKSTTLKSLMGMLARTSGERRLMTHSLTSLAPHEIARLGMGYVPEERRIFTDLTVMENLRCGQQPARKWPDGTDAPAWTLPMLFEYFPNLEALAHRLGDQMSGGEQQMLSVARTLMGNPYVVLLDEPSEGVAPIIVDALVEMIQLMRQRGVAVVLAEQNLEVAARVADRAYVIEKGQIRYEGSLPAFMEDEAARRKWLSV
ncbi:MAG TPA: ATP-binding cassette domain-containing protein [Burkholderiaceae bacterium]|nr:ATP-binding cassette domain-containing protein [Burkholderiaceae bacterium]